MDGSSATPIEAATRQGPFTSTHWSVVLAARQQEDSAASQAALGRLCSSYWRPLYAFLRRQGMPPHEAEDFIQGFFQHFLERDALRNVSPAGGKFRSFLLACLKNFLANERERARAQRRGGGRQVVSLDAAAGETQYLLEPATTLTPEALFERRWAFAVLEQSLARLKVQYDENKQGETFEHLKGFLPGSEGDAPRAVVAAKLGISAGALDVAVHRLRQRFGACLRAEVEQTVSSSKDVDEELRYLISVLGA